MQINKPSFYNDLDKTYSKIWALLDKGLSDRDNPLHIPVFICGKDNDYDGRIVVLRGLDKVSKSLSFHTDIRSNKIKILRNNTKGIFLFYDKKEKIQLRISCNTKIHHQNERANTSWKKTVHMSRQCYLGDYPPGSSAKEPTSGLSKEVDNSKYTMDESEIGYKNFCVVESFISSIEWLYLASKGHRRAQFIIENNTVFKKWLIP